MPILQLAGDSRSDERLLWSAALALVGEWPDPQTADMTLLTTTAPCSPGAHCAPTPTAVFLLTPDHRDLARSGSLRAGARSRVGFLVVTCNHQGTRSAESGFFVAEPDPRQSLANALRLTPILVRRARAAGAAPAANPALPGPDPAPGNQDEDPGRGLAAQVLQRWTSTREWRVGVRTAPHPEEITAGQLTDLTWLRPRARRKFWADPWPASDSASGQTWVFVEEYDRWIGRGRIAALRWADRRVVEQRVVLDDEHHRALPHVQRINDRWVATCDSCEQPARVFTFGALGEAWTPLPRATLPPFLSDPVLGWEAGRWTVTGTNWLEDENGACETWVTGAAELRGWTRIDAAGYADPRTARNGGPNDRALQIRVTQDCIETYGRRVVLRPVSDEANDPAKPAPLPTHPHHAVGGSHTLTWDSSMALAAVDIWWDRVDPAARIWALRDQRHLRRCRSESAAGQLRAWRVVTSTD